MIFRLALSILLAGLLLGGNLWAAGSWGCKTKPGGGWDCTWSGQGEPPKPERRQPKPKKRYQEPPPSAAPEPTSAVAASEPDPVPAAESVASEPVPPSPEAETAQVEPVSPEPRSPSPISEVNPYGQQLPPAERMSPVSAESASVTAATPVSGTDAGKSEGGWFGSIKRWVGLGEKPADQTPDNPVQAERVAAPAQPLVQGSAGLEDLQVGGGSSRATPPPAPEVEPVSEPAPKPESRSGGFAPLATLKRWVGMENKAEPAVPDSRSQSEPESMESERASEVSATAATARPTPPPRAAKPTPERSRTVEKSRKVEAVVARPKPSPGDENKIHTVQILSSSRKDLIEGLVSDYGLGARAWILEEQRGGRPWYSLLYGKYATLYEALDALPGLPEAARQHSPWVRKVEISP